MAASIRMIAALLALILPANVLGFERPPNVVLFLVDDLGWRDLGCYGSPIYETEHIDALARNGVRFSQAYAACHVCSPTRASIMTGKYPARLKLTDWLPGRREFPFQKLKNAQIHQALPLDEFTIAEALQAHGYRAAHIGKWHLGEDPAGPLQQGFDVQIPQWNKGWPKAGYHAPFEMDGLRDQAGDYLTDRLTDEAIRFMEDNKDRSFFLYLSHFAVHDPIQGREELVKKYESKLQALHQEGQAFVLEGNPDDLPALSPEELKQRVTDPAYAGFQVLSNGLVKVKQFQDNAQFAAMVESMDESLGRVLDKLKTLGLDSNTIVIVFSDNGGMSAANFGNPSRKIDPNQLNTAYSTSNLPLRGAKGWLYEGGIRVPLIVSWSGTQQPGICDVPVMSTDLFPSILDMLGLPLVPRHHVDGQSFAPILRGLPPLEREALYWHFPHYSNHGMQSPGGAIRCGDFKLLEYFENGGVQLFNLSEDPSEQHDLSTELPDEVIRLREMLHAWRSKVGAAMMPPNPDYTGLSSK